MVRGNAPTPRNVIRPRHLGVGIKPRGCLWLSCGDVWIDWVKVEMPHWLPRYRRAIVFDVDDRRLLQLRSMAALRRFHEKYVVYNDHGEGLIDWDRVRDDHPKKCGLLVWRPRAVMWNPKFLWAWSWDVCSAALWDDPREVR